MRTWPVFRFTIIVYSSCLHLFVMNHLLLFALYLLIINTNWFTVMLQINANIVLFSIFFLPFFCLFSCSFSSCACIFMWDQHFSLVHEVAHGRNGISNIEKSIQIDSVASCERRVEEWDRKVCRNVQDLHHYYFIEHYPSNIRGLGARSVYVKFRKHLKDF